MESTLTETETTFAATLNALRADEVAFAKKLTAFAEESAGEIVSHERHRAALARLNSEIGKAAFTPNGPPLMGVSALLQPLPPMRFDTAEKVGIEFSAKLMASVTRLHKGA